MTNGFRCSYPVPPALITEEDLFTIIPMDAGINVSKLTGRQLRDFWEDELDQVSPATLTGSVEVGGLDRVA